MKISNNMKDRIDRLLILEQENNRMLRSIIRYINHIEANASDENISDFYRNIIANMISERFKR